MDERLILWPGYLVLLVVMFLAIFNFITKAANDEIYKEKVGAVNIALLRDTAGISDVDVNLFLDKPLNYLLIAKDDECKIYVNFEEEISEMNAKYFDCFYFRDEEVKHINSSLIKMDKGEIV